MNANQAKTIMKGLSVDPERLEPFEKIGNLIGSGIDQTVEGEITLVMIYESGSITQEIPADRVGGFRVVIREDTKPIPFTI